MDKELKEDEQKYIPSHLLDGISHKDIDDDDIPTSTSIKNTKQSIKDFAFSAPPILFNLSYRIQQDFFEEDRKGMIMASMGSPQKSSDSNKQYEKTQFQNIVMSTRKLSLQNEEEYASYGSYQNISLPEINYYSAYSPEEQILNNLRYATEWCKDQYGSRNLQTALQTNNQFLKAKVFQTIAPRINELCYDKFANYVIQKFIDIGSPQQIEVIEEVIKKQLLFMSLHSYACRVVQKIIEAAANCINQQKEILKYLQPHLLQVIFSQNGNHIAQRIIQIFTEEATQNIGQLILRQLDRLSFHAFGCRVVQKYLQNGRNPNIRAKIMKKLIDSAIRLSKCQYGNYIMQYIVSFTNQHEEHVFVALIGSFSQLSCNKFASNVIEKFIKFAQQSVKTKVIQKLAINQELALISKNQFGNYVIQSLLEHCNKQNRNLLKNYLRDNCQQISKSQYGRHVLMQMEKYK